MRILVTGAAGMLGRDLCDVIVDSGMEPIATDLAGSIVSLDITNQAACSAALKEFRPDCVVHCAAYTNVEAAEDDPEAAYLVNETGSRVLASACARSSTPICAISTDYVFDGSSDRPYRPYDATSPLSVYGASKLAGERAVSQSGAPFWLVRTAWLYGAAGRCFPRTIFNAARSRPELSVVADQFGAPTSTLDLSAALVEMVCGKPFGTYHLANRGQASWYDVACRVLTAAGEDPLRVRPVPSSSYPTRARRPHRSVLDQSAWLQVGGTPLPEWSQSIDRFVAGLTSEAPA